MKDKSLACQRVWGEPGHAASWMLREQNLPESELQRGQDRKRREKAPSRSWVAALGYMGSLEGV